MPLEYESGTGKLPGKTEFSGRRRVSTRTSGYESHPDATGGEYRSEKVSVLHVPEDDALVVRFDYETPPIDTWVGFGGWYRAEGSISPTLHGENVHDKTTLTAYPAPDWNKFGTMWRSNGSPFWAELKLEAEKDVFVAFWALGCGTIEDEGLEITPERVLGNMHLFSPEAHHFTDEGKIEVRLQSGRALDQSRDPWTIHLKCCNRCARFLPINRHNERNPLSFSNHCVADHPCSHTGFGKLTDVDSGNAVNLEYGYQLECRYCKKIYVNTPLNKQRTAAQMKEDAARRRAFELLLQELYGESPQLQYRYQTGRELVDDVWERFGGHCFNCEKELESRSSMHLDHTRPLSLLWPLDGTATALCGSCNSEKRDRPPVDFYDDRQIQQLADLTALGEEDLYSPLPNLEAVELLEERLDWFFDDFLTRDQLTKERDGKTAAELVVKALQKTLNQCPPEYRFNLKKEFERRRG